MLENSEREELNEEVRGRFGVLPSFFQTAKEAPGLTAILWGFAKGAYLDLPLPSLFKERLFVYLSRFCEVRYCVVRHCGFLIGHGRPAGDKNAPLTSVEDALELLKRPYPDAKALKQSIELLKNLKVPLKSIPEANTELESALFHCASEIFLSPHSSEGFRYTLRNALGDKNFEYVMGYLAFIQTAHFWTLTHPELEYEEDVDALMKNHASLRKYLLEDPEAQRCEVGSKLHDELTLLRREKVEYDRLKETQRELIKTINARDEFLSIASHELRTPLTTLIMQNELLRLELQDGLEVDSIRSFLDKNEDLLLRMSNQVDQMLDIAKASSGRIELEKSKVPLGEIAKKAVDRLEMDIKKHTGAPAKLIVEKEVVGLWDELRIDQVITNLLTNAVKYGEGKPIEVRVTCKGQEALCVVKDQGRGIPREKLMLIFDKFERAIDKNEVSGLGLGLYIANRIVIAHEGRIEVESELGKGSAFTVKLPIEKCEEVN